MSNNQSRKTQADSVVRFILHDIRDRAGDYDHVGQMPGFVILREMVSEYLEHHPAPELEALTDPGRAVRDLLDSAAARAVQGEGYRKARPTGSLAFGASPWEMPS